MLTEDQKRLLIEKIKKGEPLPAEFRRLLFAQDDVEYVERTGVYTLEYKGKTREQDILADTPAAPLQEMRSFNADNPHPDPHEDWRNLLIYGDNLLALKALYEDQRGPNRFGTRNKIKLIYIDPPFATKQDFMKDREKAYRDKLIGAQFIEFLRKRLVLLRELLADDGSIYVHLDSKKAHYMKAVMDEIFGEENFVNEIVWKRSDAKGDATQGSKHYSRVHDTIFFYRKNDSMVWNPQFVALDTGYVDSFYRYRDPDGRRWKMENMLGPGGAAKGNPIYEVMGVSRPWRYSKTKMAQKIADGLVVQTNPGTVPMEKKYLDASKGTQVGTWWDDISMIRGWSSEKTNYPTQKPEEFIERVIMTSSNEGDIVLDAFMGSGSTPATAEKLNRRWIGIDCGRLAIYTAQKRLLNLSTQIGAEKKDDRREADRVEDFSAHSKSGSKAGLLLFDKAKAGELEITDAFLADLGKFLIAHCPAKKGKVSEFSLFCPEEKLSLRKLKVIESDDLKAGQRAVDVAGVRFLISFIEPKAKTEPAKPLKAKQFALFNAGVYDRAKIRELDWANYKPFVMQLFGVREDPHPIRAFNADGYIGTDSVHVWNYPDQKNLVLDEGYIESLHDTMRGEGGDRFYVIAPVSALAFMADEVRVGHTRYIVLKVPESVLNRLLVAGAPGSLKQPMSDGDVNAVIDAVGFDFVSQPLTEQQFLLLPPEDADLTNQHLREAVVRLSEFRAKTLTTAPEDFPNFATLSMVMIDPDFDGDVFSLGRVLWAEDLVTAELKRLDISVTGDHAARVMACDRLDIRIPEEELGERVMLILVDQYGNEKQLVVAREEFAETEPSRRRVVVKATGAGGVAKKTTAEKATPKKTMAKKVTARKTSGAGGQLRKGK